MRRPSRCDDTTSSNRLGLMDEVFFEWIYYNLTFTLYERKKLVLVGTPSIVNRRLRLVSIAPVLVVETHDADDDLLLLLISFVLVLLLFVVIGRRLCLSSLFCRNRIPAHHMSERLVV
jgi:hypothetical protein